MNRLPTIFGAPTRAAVAIAMRSGARPTPRWIGHGQQLAAQRLGYDPTAPEPDPLWKVRMPAGGGPRPRKSRGPTGFDFSKCDPARHLNSSAGKRQWRAKRDAKAVSK